MARHKYAELIHAWAEGAEIEHNAIDNPDDSGWLPASNPAWDSEFLKFRAKPNWWENIPKHGVLCWVCDVNESPNSDHSMAIIISSALKTNQGAYWHYATPLTNEEIKQFLRGE